LIQDLRERALAYHSEGRPGKIRVVPTKPTKTQHDLSLAYTPGVAEPCREIARDPQLAYRYTAKGNLVAVVSNGTAVLGLGNLGALAGKPVMEGKGVLFKRFADIDVFDIEIDSQDLEEVIRTVELISPTFGGINLEDIRAPECFEIEERLIELLDIPVFHDDQHGTAIISGAALINALHITGRRIEDARVVFSGAGAAGIGCARFYRDLGVAAENMTLCDSHGVIYAGRAVGMNRYKAEFARENSARTLADALRGADVFCGLSQAGVVTPEMVKSMAAQPILFAMANPDPEILPDQVKAVRKDAIIATGRSDYPNQVNNVLGFPFIFRAALDVQASRINEPMKLAAAHALAELTRRGKDVPQIVRDAYGNENFELGPNYIIPKPFDPRLLTEVVPAVAQAAMDSGVARRKLDLAEYGQQLGKTSAILSNM
jgi:malate dehydrogenase (oxaloacetate-decarboxylating)(NADP+)